MFDLLDTQLAIFYKFYFTAFYSDYRLFKFDTDLFCIVDYIENYPRFDRNIPIKHLQFIHFLAQTGKSD